MTFVEEVLRRACNGLVVLQPDEFDAFVAAMNAKVTTDNGRAAIYVYGPGIRVECADAEVAPWTNPMLLNTPHGWVEVFGPADARRHVAGIYIPIDSGLRFGANRGARALVGALGVCEAFKSLRGAS